MRKSPRLVKTCTVCWTEYPLCLTPPGSRCECGGPLVVEEKRKNS